MENWKAIEGFEAYEVSDLGRVRRIKQGNSNNSKVGRISKQYPTRGYLYVKLTLNGKQWGKLVHVLVAKAFLPNPLNLPEVNHLGSKSDCRASMLKWISIEDHGRDRARRGQAGDGVYFDKRAGKYCAHWSPEPYKKEHLGSYSTLEEAKRVRDAKVATL